MTLSIRYGKEADFMEKKRIDRKHRFVLRIDEVAHHEVDVIAFRQNTSLNLVYCQAVEWAMRQQEFQRYMKETFPRDERRGHFAYIVERP